MPNSFHLSLTRQGQMEAEALNIMNFITKLKKDQSRVNKRERKKLSFRLGKNGRKINFKLSTKRFLVYLIPAVMLTIILILLSPYIFRSWTKYPEELRVEIAWQEFINTFNGPCRESCLASRQSYASIWRPAHLKQVKLQEKALEQVFASDNSELQKAMIKIVAADNGSTALPVFFAKQLMDQNLSDENRRLIVTFFPEAFNNSDWLSAVRDEVDNFNLTVQDRAYALSLLASYPESENIIFLKRIILEEREKLILESAFRVVSAWPKSSLALNEEDLDNLTQAIINSADISLRWRRIWILSEFEVGLSACRREKLTQIANRGSLDNISRGLAAEALRLEYGLEINTPEPTNSEWQELYDYL